MRQILFPSLVEGDAERLGAKQQSAGESAIKGWGV
jgi:hypothetical protein